MSMWGCRTGYGYNAERVTFLREMYKSERRQYTLSLSPREDPAVAALNSSLRLPATASTTSGSLSARPVYSITGAPIDPSPVASPRPHWATAINTTQQIAFPPLDRSFTDRFVRPTDKPSRPRYDAQGSPETKFREQIYEMRNVSGVKYPASFRP